MFGIFFKDNRDAEAFLKPVSKIDYPDYYESMSDLKLRLITCSPSLTVIGTPMDFQTMLKKVKQKQYKSKKEFSDDLRLIWENCNTYNTGDVWSPVLSFVNRCIDESLQNHPLRLCANRLKQKAIKLLENITDRRDRLDPPVPSEVGTLPPRVNGFMVNGHSREHSTPPPVRPRPGEALTLPRHLVNGKRVSPPAPKQEVPFAESPALVRTPSGMATFADLDRDLENVAGPSNLNLPVLDRLDRIVDVYDEEMFAVNGDIGDKRKL